MTTTKVSQSVIEMPQDLVDAFIEADAQLEELLQAFAANPGVAIDNDVDVDWYVTVIRDYLSAMTATLDAVESELISRL